MSMPQSGPPAVRQRYPHFSLRYFRHDPVVDRCRKPRSRYAPGTTEQAKQWAPPVRMKDCPKWHHCKAPVCPLRKDCLRTRQLRGETVCYYLLEVAKPHWRQREWGSIERKIMNWVSEVRSLIVERYGSLRRPLRRAEQTPSRRRLTQDSNPSSDRAQLANLCVKVGTV